jgi:hypothetical protein
MSNTEITLLVRENMSRDELHKEAAWFAQQGICVMFFSSQQEIDGFVQVHADK